MEKSHQSVQSLPENKLPGAVVRSRNGPRTTVHTRGVAVADLHFVVEFLFGSASGDLDHAARACEGSTYRSVIIGVRGVKRLSEVPVSSLRPRSRVDGPMSFPIIQKLAHLFEAHWLRHVYVTAAIENFSLVSSTC